MDNKEDIVHSEKKTEMEYRVKGGTATDVAAARKALEDIVRRIPDSALKGLKSFRMVIMA